MPIVLIMAGGVGERFWPASKKSRPKQFLPLISSSPMICETINRTKDVVDISNTFIVTVKSQKDLISECVQDFPINNLILEPTGRNTAPCIALAIFTLLKKYSKEEIVAVLPADHYIANSEVYSNLLSYAFSQANKTEKFITFGISPDRPETGYGYIEIGDRINNNTYEGIRFVEKPDKTLANKYIASQKYLWNSGMFVFKIATFLDQLEKLQPEIYYSVLEISQETDIDVINEKYAQLPSISIDYAIMEKLKEFLVIPANIGWDDVGSWRSLETTKGKDENGNVLLGDCIIKDVKDTIVFNEGKLIAAVGLEGLVVVNTEDALLVIPKDRLNEIKDIVAELKVKKREEKI